ncbi:MAG: PleD family two-component system response regulator [Acidobacteriota bacterium]
MNILIAEDERVSRTLLRAAVEKLGHTVIEANDGYEAWKYLAETEIPLLITDWMMPGLDGPTVCRLLRAEKLRPYTYVILLTAAEGKHRCAEAMDAGADDFITKPLDATELGARLRIATRFLALRQALHSVSTVLPVCIACHRIQHAGGNWQSLDAEVGNTASGPPRVCPSCADETPAGAHSSR